MVTRTSAGCAGLRSECLDSMGSSQWLSVSCVEERSSGPFVVWAQEALESAEEAEISGVWMWLVLVELRHSKSDVRYQRHNVFS